MHQRDGARLGITIGMSQHKNLGVSGAGRRDWDWDIEHPAPVDTWSMFLLKGFQPSKGDAGFLPSTELFT